MKTLVIPIDFSLTSRHAVDFAVEWCKKYVYERIILLRSFYSSMYEDMIMSADFSNVNEEYLNKKRNEEKELLSSWCKEVAAQCVPGIRVQTAVSELPLVRSVIELVRDEKPEMILLGSSSLPTSNQAFVAGNIIAIARLSPVRVLIVPENCTYREVTRAIVPVDFNTVASLNKINRLRASPKWHDVEILALNIDTTFKEVNRGGEFKEAEDQLHDYLKNFKHEIYYEKNKNVINGILGFEKLKQAQLLIALPGVHSFLYSLTHKSVSEALYKKCSLPVMILK